MISRFVGDEGRARLISAIRRQQIVLDEEVLASEIADIGELIQIEPTLPDAEFIKQNSAENEVYFIVSGRVSIVVNGREVATRVTGDHVGDMALIDPTARRSASVIATEQTVLLRVGENGFTQLGNKFPQLWRRLALELANRLRQRGNLVKAPNSRLEIFIGSSVEGLNVAREIQAGLSHDGFVVRVWTDGVFQASRTAIEDLTKAVAVSDAAILVLTADDTITSRDLEKEGPRDNVIFELGLFMGALGRGRTFIVKPRGGDMKIPSDLLGVTMLDYTVGSPDAIAADIAPICHAVRKLVKAAGAK